MNRLGDCICAIPSKPPEEHFRHCPVRIRHEVFERLQRLPEEERLRFVMEVLSGGGAGAVQAPGRARDARQGAPRRAAARWLRLVKPSHPNQPHAFTGRPHVADRAGRSCETCGLSLGALEGLSETLRMNCPGGPRRGGP